MVALVIILLAVAVIRRRKARRQRQNNTATAPAASLGEQVPVFNVVTVGARGSGKTLLLASMFHELQTLSGRSFFLTAPHDQVIALNEWYTETADTDRNWPAGTSGGETRTFNFMVRTRLGSGASRPVLQVDYLDYAGGLLTDAQAPGSMAQAEVLERIGSAHGLVGIIDGYRIRQMIDGVGPGRARLAEGIDTLISLMLLATCPVTFVVTKWDLLRDLDVDENASLKMVKKHLMYVKGFRDLVEQHSFDRVVRLIPVSAVGPDFAVLDQAGRVAKMPAGEVHPTNVDAPLCALVPDLFEQVELTVDAAQMQAEFDRIRKQTRLGPAAAAAELGRFLALRTGKILSSLGPGVAGFVGDAALAAISKGADSARADRQASIDMEVSVAQRDIEEFRNARRRVLREFQRRVDVLEGQLPGSRLLNQD